MNWKILGLLAAVPFLMGNDGGCSRERDSDRRQNEANEKLAAEAVSQVGVPAMVNFQEKRMAKMLYELRDTEIKTVSYLVDFNSKLVKLCDSIGYGLPYATQYSNPQRLANPSYSQSTAIPQAEPNGLFMPAQADGTWVMCINPQSGKVQPVYVEPRVIVSPFALQ